MLRAMTATAPEHPPRAMERLQRVRVLQGRLSQVDRQARVLSDERNALFRALMEEDGIERAEIARWAEMSSQGVEFAAYGRKGRGGGRSAAATA
jgi:hypothetical protein